MSQLSTYGSTTYTYLGSQADLAMSTVIKRVDSPDEVRSFENGKVEVVNLRGFSILRMTLQPGWKWSKSIKPIAKTESCQAHHIGYVLSGRLKVVAGEGREMELKPGDATRSCPAMMLGLWAAKHS